jgi:hypothetical protein
MVNSADCFSILVNEIMDISSVVQFSIGVIYGCEDKIREVFRQFELLMKWIDV